MAAINLSGAKLPMFVTGSVQPGTYTVRNIRVERKISTLKAAVVHGIGDVRIERPIQLIIEIAWNLRALPCKGNACLLRECIAP